MPMMLIFAATPMLPCAIIIDAPLFRAFDFAAYFADFDAVTPRASAITLILPSLMPCFIDTDV